jgi:hypothetical protein
MASSSLDTTDSNHTYEPIETAQAMMTTETTSGQRLSSMSQQQQQQQQHPVTLIHHDGRRVTTNRIVSLESLREVLLEHEKVPYDDPECRGDLYILAPMRLLTPVIEESESEFTRSKLYQSLTQGSNHSGTNYQTNYSDVDTSIMSIISEVLHVRSTAAAKAAECRDSLPSRPQATANGSMMPVFNDDRQGVDTSSLLHTIEEIRNSSLCNLYYSSTPSLQDRPGKPPPPLLPQVPPRHTAGYASLCKENKESKAAAGTRHDVQSSRGIVNPPSPVPQQQLDESVRSVDSNTLVVTPPTVKRQRSKKKSSLSEKIGGGCRKNILDLVGGDAAQNILNTPKSLKMPDKLTLADSNPLSDSLASESNEFRALMPHLTNTGAKFLSRVVKAAGGVAGGGGVDSDLDASHNFPPPQPRRASVGADVSTFSAETPSPKQFVRHFSNNNKNIKPLPPRRKFSLVRPRFDSNCSGGAESTSDDGENSDIKYGFMPPEHPDAKYGFGIFGDVAAASGDSGYNVVETAKLCNNSLVNNYQLPARADRVGSTSTPKADSAGHGFVLPVSSTAYSLSALNRADTAFKLHPEDKYENLHHQARNIPRNSWQSASLHQRRPFGDSVGEESDSGTDILIGQRTDAGRRSMSILDDYLDEKENVRRPPPAPGSRCIVSEQPAKRRPLAVLNKNKTSPLKILGQNLRQHSPQARVYRLNQTAASRLAAPAKSKLFGK